jgi:hypothetical protein
MGLFCGHRPKIRQRTYSDGYCSACVQCEDCGAYLGVFKQPGPDVTALPVWDAALQQAGKQRREAFYAERYQRTRAEWLAKYHVYLLSEPWRKRRDGAMERAGWRCERCGERAEHVHHRSYERVFEERPEDLEAVCGACHRHEHGIAEPA